MSAKRAGTADKNARRDAVILKALKHAPFDGWGEATLRHAAEDADLKPSDAQILFPNGARDAVSHFIGMADRLMTEDYAKQDVSKLKHREKISLIVRLRLQRWTPHREAVRRALALSPLPSMAGSSLKAAFGTVDAIWKAIGDRSVDFNFYTKRLLLAGVYGSTVLYWLEDRSENCTATWAFLERRIDDVMQVPKVKARLADRLKALPSPVGALKRVTGLRARFAPIRSKS